MEKQLTKKDSISINAGNIAEASNNLLNNAIKAISEEKDGLSLAQKDVFINKLNFVKEESKRIYDFYLKNGITENNFDQFKKDMADSTNKGLAVCDDYKVEVRHMRDKKTLAIVGIVLTGLAALTSLGVAGIKYRVK